MSNSTNDVAIIGVGLHPFGRFDKTAMEMGADAIQAALTDAGLNWKDIQFGFGGSYEVSNPDAVTRLVGLTGITFTNVFNACATSASAIQQTADTIRLGKYDIGIAIGLDKHPAARSPTIRPNSRCRSGMPTTASSSPPNSSG